MRKLQCVIPWVFSVIYCQEKQQMEQMEKSRYGMALISKRLPVIIEIKPFPLTFEYLGDTVHIPHIKAFHL